jgi:GNAT superfamily N-acetyltransferase
MGSIRRCDGSDVPAILAIINAAAEAYRGVIPVHQWHEPYMSHEQLCSEIEAGVCFWGYERDVDLVGVMGLQAVKDADLIRHAYVSPHAQRMGIGAQLMEHLRQRAQRQMLVGTWAAAHWAIRFYEQHGFRLARKERAAELLRSYWSITPAQALASVVLAHPPLEEDSAAWHQKP